MMSQPNIASLHRPCGYPKIYLASQSPRRQELLQQIGISFETLLPDADENVETLELKLPDEKPHCYVQRVTRLKLEAALMRFSRRQWIVRPILCADTIVAVEGEIWGKPRDADHAKMMLTRLSGSTHQVMTAVGMVCPPSIGDRNGETTNVILSESMVRFRPLSEQEIADYITSGEPFGKAGAYAIQGWAATFIEHISGSYSGIMGLPLFETAALLRQINHSGIQTS